MIGDMWKSNDKCQFYECTSNIIGDNITEAKIVSYRKSCPTVKDCPSKQISMKDCCLYCENEQQPNDSIDLDAFVHRGDKYDEEMSRDTYMQHPCRRKCGVGESPKVCEYTFVVN